MNRNGSKLAVLLCTVILPFLLCGCPTDPLELPGSYDTFVGEEFLLDYSEEPGDPNPVRIYAPSLDGGESMAPGPFGLVLFLPGYAATYDQYNNYHHHLTSHGFIVVGMNLNIPTDFDRRHDYVARQAVNVLDYLLGEDSPLDGIVDSSMVATAGHSMGGKIAFYAAYMDSRIGVVMTMDPTNGAVPGCITFPETCTPYSVAPNPSMDEIGLLDEVNVASLIMRTSPDALNPIEETNASFYFYGMDGQGAHAVKNPALYYDLGDVGHSSFVYIGNPEVPRITKRTFVAFLKAHFYGENMDPYLTGKIVGFDVDAGTILDIQTR